MDEKLSTPLARFVIRALIKRPKSYCSLKRNKVIVDIQKQHYVLRGNMQKKPGRMLCLYG